MLRCDSVSLSLILRNPAGSLLISCKTVLADNVLPLCPLIQKCTRTSHRISHWNPAWYFVTSHSLIESFKVWITSLDCGRVNFSFITFNFIHFSDVLSAHQIFLSAIWKIHTRCVYMCVCGRENKICCHAVDKHCAKSVYLLIWLVQQHHSSLHTAIEAIQEEKYEWQQVLSSPVT